MKAALMWSVLSLCLVYSVSAEDTAPAEAWETLVLTKAMQLPLKLEQAFFDLYQALQMRPILHICVFYCAAFYLICRLWYGRATLNIPMAYKVVDERAQSEALGLVAAELRKVKKDGQVEGLHKELSLLLESHHEFQREILDSHRDILREVSKASTSS